MSDMRLPAAALGFSAVGLVTLVMSEGYTDQAVIPVPGDVATYGFGSTHREDGSPVRPGDRITPPKAIRLTVGEIERSEARLRVCVTAPVYQHEYDAMVDLAYNVGVGKVCASSLVAKTNAGDYAGACAEYYRWRYYQGHDCSLPESKKLCGGIWTRRQQMAARCRGEAK